MRVLTRCRRCLLADDMGLGKTVQAIAAMTHLQQTGQVRHALVVTPASLLSHWRRSLQQFAHGVLQKNVCWS
ncbi:MAG: SNF2-related protein [Acidimicrobiia bacterium]